MISRPVVSTAPPPLVGGERVPLLPAAVVTTAVEPAEAPSAPLAEEIAAPLAAALLFPPPAAEATVEAPAEDWGLPIVVPTSCAPSMSPVRLMPDMSGIECCANRPLRRLFTTAAAEAASVAPPPLPLTPADAPPPVAPSPDW